MLTFGSLFAGIEGFGHGLEQAGLSVRWQCEADPRCVEVLERHYPTIERFPDVTTAEPGPVDLVCAGWPCQDLSVAGNRRGLAGERSGLFWEFARIVGELRPEWVLGENVPGLLSSHDGRDMGEVVRTLVELGYGVVWRVLDAQYFGVAQRRRRVFLVGRLGGRPPAEVLFDRASLSRHPPTRSEAGAGVAPTLEAGANRTGGDRPPGTTADTATSLIAYPLSTKHRDGDCQDTCVTHPLTASTGSEDGTGRMPPLVAFNCQQDPISDPAIATGTSGGADRAVLAFDTTQITHPENRCNPQPGDPSHPLASGAHPPAITGSIPRRLTPTECERLQGFPDDWTATGSNGPIADDPRYRMLGNAVAVPVARWIGTRLLRAANA